MKTKSFVKLGALSVFLLTGGGILQARSIGFPYFSLDFGLGSSSFVDGKGLAFEFLLDPKIAISPSLTLGSKNGISYTFTDSNENSGTDVGSENLLALETQAYLRWNFYRPVLRNANTLNFFAQAGLGLLAVYRDNDPKNNRGSILADATFGVTIPFNANWHIEPSIRAGYPFIVGAAVTVGRRFPMKQIKPQINIVGSRIEYVQIINTIPAQEIIKSILINQVEYVLFAADSSDFNHAIDNDARNLNDLVIAQTARILRENENFRLRIEGHANPVSHVREEIEELLSLSADRANEVARVLIENGVHEDQIVVIAYGGTRTVANDEFHANSNRRVELIIIEVSAQEF